MKVSRSRMEESLELRNAACSILERFGANIMIPDSSGNCHRCKVVKINGLEIMRSRPFGGEWQLDVWRDRKVFSISWTDFGPLYVAAFSSGDWPGLLSKTAIEFGWRPAIKLPSDGSNELPLVTGISIGRKSGGGQTH